MSADPATSQDVTASLSNAADYANAARILRAEKRVDDADAMLSDGIERFPEHIGLAIDYCSAAMDRHEWSEALQRWERLQRAFPNELRGYIGAALALRELKKCEEGEARLLAAIDRFPEHPHPPIHYASFAQHRGDLSEALRRWERVRRRFPVPRCWE